MNVHVNDALGGDCIHMWVHQSLAWQVCAKVHKEAEEAKEAAYSEWQSRGQPEASGTPRFQA